MAHIETLPTVEQKISYLIIEKTRSEQDDYEYARRGFKSFAEKCDLEINKLKELERLNSKPEQGSKVINKHKDLTLDRATLFFSYLLTYSKAKGPNTKKAEVISFLTGFSKNTINNKLSTLHSKADDNFVQYENDMKIVRKYFEKLGLSEIVEIIDRDLNL